jgi:hypothetical protein
VRLVDFAHTSRADERLDYLRPKLRAGTQEHDVSDRIARNRPSVRRGMAREKLGLVLDDGITQPPSCKCPEFCKRGTGL